MKTHILKKSFFLIFLVYSFAAIISCKKEDEPTKEITYEVSGNFGKTVNVKYTPTAGTLANIEETVTLPWRKTVLPNAENASVGLVVTGTSGLPGANVNAKIFVNGVEERTVLMLADASGNFNINT
ncbi:MAG: hypothetical protein EOP00_14220, partial [Pedobacter sp.]